MYLKLKRPDGCWELHECKRIIFSEHPTALNGRDADEHFSNYIMPYLPRDFRSIMSNYVTVDSITCQEFHPDIYYDSSDLKWCREVNPHSKHNHINFSDEGKADKDIPKCWEGRIPLYSFAIFPEEHKAVVFPTVAYIINDDGKTINKIG